MKSDCKVKERLPQNSWLEERSFNKASKRLKIVKSATSESKVSRRLLQKSCVQEIEALEN